MSTDTTTAPASASTGGQIFGYELRLNLADCDRAIISSGAELLSWAQRVVDAIDMNPYGEPWIEHFGPKNDPSKIGFTLFFPIETSNLLVHACDDSRTAFINVYSCKKFNPQVVVDLTKLMFDTELCVVQDFSERRAPVRA